MEKWKIAVIVALLFGLVGIGFYQNNAGDSTPVVDPTPSAPAKASPFLGKPLPAWNFTTWQGKPTTLASLKGKPALVEIFRIQCPHCQEAAPFMEGLYKRYAARGLQIVGIQSPRLDIPSENNWPDVQAWLKEKGTSYPVAFDPKAGYFLGAIKKDIYAGNDKEMAWPTIVILDPKGKTVYAQIGYDTSKPRNLTAIVNLAVAVEKFFPSGKTPARSAQNLITWLKAAVPELVIDPKMEQDIVKQLAKK